jgi:hypothetical protein
MICSITSENQKSFVVEFNEPEVSIYQLAENATGCPEELLRGFAFVESSYNQFAIGDDGRSHGLTQSNEIFHDYYASLWGEYNPFDALDSLILAGRIYTKDLKTTGSTCQAICAHRQGVTGVRRNGCTKWYLNRVLFHTNGYLKIKTGNCWTVFPTDTI